MATANNFLICYIFFFFPANHCAFLKNSERELVLNFMFNVFVAF